MKILQITSAFYPFIGGTEKVVCDISQELARRGHEIDVLTTDLYSNGGQGKIEKKEGVRIICSKNLVFLRGYGFSLDFAKYLRENWKNYDIAHVHGFGRYASDFSLFYLRDKIPIIFTAHGFMHTRRDILLKKVHLKTLGQLTRLATFCTALTEVDMPTYHKLGVSQEKIALIPNGVSLGKYNGGGKMSTDAFCEKYGIADNFILYVGRIHPSKGLKYLIKSVEKIDCKVVIIGKDMGYQAKLIKLVKKLDMEKKITFTGPLPENEIISAYKSCDVFVLPSQVEGFGITIVEAMAAKKPVIGSTVGATSLLIKDGWNGYKVNYGDVKQLENKIGALLENEELAKKMGMNGRKLVEENFGWERIIPKLEELYIIACK